MVGLSKLPFYNNSSSKYKKIATAHPNDCYLRGFPVEKNIEFCEIHKLRIRLQQTAKAKIKDHYIEKWKKFAKI